LANQHCGSSQYKSNKNAWFTRRRYFVYLLVFKQPITVETTLVDFDRR